MIETLAAWSVKHRLLVASITALIVAASAWQARTLPLDALPDLTNNQVIVLTGAAGLSPEEVELTVTWPIEVALGGLPDVAEQRSLSRYGISAVTVVFEDDVDPWRARQMVSERLLSTDLPQGVTAPELAPLTGGLGEIFHITLASDQRSPAELLELATLRIAPLLKSVRGVVEVNSWGGARRTYDVVANAESLAARGLQLSDLHDTLASTTAVAAGGALNANDTQVLLRAQARPRSLEDLRAARITSGGVRIGDVAKVVEGHALRLGAATENGKCEVVYLMAQMLRDENALEVMDAIQARMPAIRQALPADVTLTTIYDRSALVRRTLKTVGINLLEGFTLVSLVLLAFLGSWRAGLIVASVIPLSMALATAVMATLKLPGNLMSLGALDFGLLVDGAVVMVEGVFHHAHDDHGLTWTEHVQATARRAARPVFFAVLMIVLVYVPVLAMTGTDGKLFRPMALTVVIALLFALILSLTYVPALCALWLREAHVPRRDPLLVRALEAVYLRVLSPLFAHRVVVLALACALLVAGVFALNQRGVEFTPQLDEGDLVIQTTHEPDIRLDTSVARGLQLEALLRERFPEVTRVVTRIGSPAVATDIMGLEQADAFVGLKPRSAWRAGLTRDALVDDMQRTIEQQISTDELSFTQPIQMRFNELLGGAVTDVAVNLYGDNLNELDRLATEVAQVIEATPGAKDVRVLSPPAVPVLSVRPRALDAAQHDLPVREVLDAVQALRVGVVAGETLDGAWRIPVRLMLGSSGRASDLSQVRLPVHGGGLVKLSQVAEIEEGRAPSLVNRHNGQRRTVIGFNVRGADLATVVLVAQSKVAKALTLPAGYRLEWGGQYASLVAAGERLALIVPTVLVLILALLVLAFRHLRPALAVFTVVPIAAVGGVFTLALRSLPISLPAAIGFIALSGIAVMNGVVWMTRALDLESQGLSPQQTATVAARQRMRPVLMTALVAAFGFLPMMLSSGDGAEVQRPLATVVVGGLVTSTWLTLIVLPVLYPWIRPRGAFPKP